MTSPDLSEPGLSEQDRTTNELLPVLTSFFRRLRGRRVAMIPHPGPIGGEQPVGGKSGALRAAIFGVNDGLVSNFSLVMGVAGGTSNNSIVLLAGIAGLVAGAFSMASGEWISIRSQRELYENELRIEQEELRAFPEEERDAVEAVHGAHQALHGKKALIVDDDMRNIFALATVLDNEGMVIVSADNGREAIRLVESDPAIDIVLMDIMMPELDGIATMQEIRRLPRGRELPMVAVTAKAMKGDRQKCIEAGAWDYVSKPVDRNQLLSVLRGWLCH